MPDKISVKVLIVDDDTNLRELLAEAVRDWGYDVYIAESCEDAIDLMADERFNIVICDLKMPGRGGLSLLERIKSRRKDVNVIIITGYATIDTAVKVIEAGAYDYLTKPFQLDELKAVLKKSSDKPHLPQNDAVLFDKLRDTYGDLEVMKTIQRNRTDKPS